MNFMLFHNTYFSGVFSETPTTLLISNIKIVRADQTEDFLPDYYENL